MPGSVFCSLTMKDMGRLIMTAQRRVIFCGPGLNQDVASAICQVAKRLGAASVHAILDVNEENCRVGYGDVEGYALLVDNGVTVRRCNGLRIGFLLADEAGYIFACPAAMVENQATLQGAPNAIRATREQVEELVQATAEKTSAAPPSSHPPAQAMLPITTKGPEIGLEKVAVAEVRKIEKSIQEVPVRDFDLDRVVRVFNSRIQFVELSVEGAQLENHKVRLPTDVLTAVKDKRTRERMSAAFKILAENSKVGGDKIRTAANEIRAQFIKAHPIYGGIVLKSKVGALEAKVAALRADLDKHREAVRQRLGREVQKSKKELVQAFWRAIRASPPPNLLSQIPGDKPTMEEAKAYLAMLLDQAFPSLDAVCDGMKVTYVAKDVTWHTLNDEQFRAWLVRKFPLVKQLKLPFEEFEAAKQRAPLKPIAKAA